MTDSTTPTPPRPWKGLAAYTEGEQAIFFGRDADADALTAVLERATLSVLFGASGLGKTSLLEAGVFPRLRPARRLPVYIRLAHLDDVAVLDDQVLAAIAAAAKEAGLESPPVTRGDGLWKHLHRRGLRYWAEDQWPVTPVLVLDQFEEIFTLGQETERRRDRSRAFLQSLSELVENRPPADLRARLESGGAAVAAELSDTFDFEGAPVRVLLSLREDYLAYLEALRDLFPTVRQNRMRLTAMTAAQAREVIDGPGRRFPEHRVLGPQATDAILTFVTGARAGMSEGVVDEQRPIEPAFLSLVCDELYRRRPPDSKIISREQVQAQQGEIIRGFYEDAFAVVEDEGQRQRVRRFVEDDLVSSGGHRNSLTLDDADDRADIQPGILNALVKRRLLRYEDRPGVARRVELSHDVLLAVARQGRMERRQREREADLEREREAERERAERADREKLDAQAGERRARRLLAATAVALVAALAGLAFGVHGQIRAAREARATLISRDRATLIAAQADFDRAVVYLDNGDTETPLAIAHLARALRTRPDMEAVAWRVFSVLTWRSRPAPIGEPLRHQGIVNAANFSPDGRRVITASSDWTARIWDAATGKPLTQPLQHQGSVRAASFSPDGRRVITASSDWTARIWDAATGKPLIRHLQHLGPVNGASFSPDGHRVLTASSDMTANIWDATTGKPLTRSLRHQDIVLAASFSPDGRRVLTASSDDTARIWEAATGKPLTQPLRHEGSLNAASFSPDGRRMITASDDTACIWDAATGKPLTEPLQHQDFVNAANFSPDGRRVITASSDNTAHIWDAATGEPLAQPLQHQGIVRAASFSPDGHRVITASNDKTARIWDAATGKPLTEPLQHENFVNAANFSPDGRRVITVSSDKTARIWDATTGKPLTQSLHHQGSLNTASFSPDGHRVLTASWDMTARIWDATTGKPLILPLQHQGVVRAASFSPDGHRVLTASWDMTARIWDATTGKPLTLPLGHQDIVRAASFSPDGHRVLTASSDRTARIWDAATGKPLTQPLQHQDIVNAASFSPDGRHVITASWDRTARIWDAATGKPLTQPLQHQDIVRTTSFSPDGRRVITASADMTARIWDAATGKPLTQPLQHQGAVYAASFSPDGRRVITASSDRTARIWDAATGKPLTQPLQHQDTVYMASFNPDGRRVITASEDNTARIWEVATGKPLTQPLQHQDTVYMASFNPDGRRVITASEDNTARIWEVAQDPIAPPWFADWLEGVAGNRLDENGLLQPTEQRVRVPADAPLDSFKHLALWFDHAPGPQRPVSPGSRQTTREWVDDRLAAGDKWALSEAYDTLPGSPEVLAAWAELLARDPGGPKNRLQAAFYAQYATQHAATYAEDENDRPHRPRQARVHHRVAKAWAALDRKADARAALETALRLDPENEVYRAFQEELAGSR